MSFSSWDDGSWRSILKEDEEDAIIAEEERRETEEETFEDPFGQHDGEITAPDKRAIADAAHRKKIRAKREGMAEDPVAEEKRTGKTFEGVSDRKEEGSDTDKKPKKTDKQLEQEYDRMFSEGKYAGQDTDWKEQMATSNRSGKKGWFNRIKQAGKDVVDRVSPNTNTNLWGEEQTYREKRGDNYGKVSQLPFTRNQSMNPTKWGVNQDANISAPARVVGNMVRGRVPGLGPKNPIVTGASKIGARAKDAMGTGAAKVKDAASRANRQRRHTQDIKRVDPLVQEAYKDLSQDVSGAFPDEMTIVTQKVSELLGNASQEIMSGEKPSNVNSITEWMDIYQTVAPNSAETEEKKQAWEKILEAAKA